MADDFQEKLEFGLDGENKVAKFMLSHGYDVLQIYKKEGAEKQGPRLLSSLGHRVAPDMMVFRNGKQFWIEVKRKTGATWFKLSEQWETGINRRHFNEYCAISEMSQLPLWIIFIQEGGPAERSGPVTPKGWFCQSIEWLKANALKKTFNPSMIYWRLYDMKQLDANPEEVRNGQPRILDVQHVPVLL